MSEIHVALAAVQAELDALKKTATNPHFKSQYIPLEDIVEATDPLLEKHGLLFYTAPTDIGMGSVAPALRYRLVHLDTGQEITDVMPLVLDKQNSQGVGSAITYARRYILTSLLNIIADVDDDGNKASEPAKKAEPKADSFTDKVRATGKKAAEIREWAAGEGYTLDDVGVDAKDLTKFLNSLSGMKQAKLLEWAK